jgi:hypothetical protein
VIVVAGLGARSLLRLVAACVLCACSFGISAEATSGHEATQSRPPAPLVQPDFELVAPALSLNDGRGKSGFALALVGLLVLAACVAPAARPHLMTTARRAKLGVLRWTPAQLRAPPAV